MDVKPFKSDVTPLDLIEDEALPEAFRAKAEAWIADHDWTDRYVYVWQALKWGFAYGFLEASDRIAQNQMLGKR